MPSNQWITWHPPFWGAFFMYSAFSEPNKYKLYTKQILKRVLHVPLYLYSRNLSYHTDKIFPPYTYQANTFKNTRKFI